MPSTTVFYFKHDVQVNSLKFLATVGTGIFAGAALAINVFDVPARRELEPKAALTQWRAMFNRAKKMQASIAVGSALASLAVGYLSKDRLWYAGGCMMLGMLPYTLFAIMPTNNKLLDSNVRLTTNTSISMIGYEHWLNVIRYCALLYLRIDGSGGRVDTCAHRVLVEIASRPHARKLRRVRPICLATALSDIDSAFSYSATNIFAADLVFILNLLYV